MVRKLAEPQGSRHTHRPAVGQRRHTHHSRWGGPAVPRCSTICAKGGRHATPVCVGRRATQRRFLVFGLARGLPSAGTSPLVLGGVSSTRKARQQAGEGPRERIHRRFLKTLRKELFARGEEEENGAHGRSHRRRRRRRDRDGGMQESCRRINSSVDDEPPGKRAVNRDPLFSTGSPRTRGEGRRGAPPLISCWAARDERSAGTRFRTVGWRLAHPAHTLPPAARTLRAVFLVRQPRRNRTNAPRMKPLNGLLRSTASLLQ
ncbi:hypothetical protein MTO96_010796 [Rhipicephalus appendiculatus]